MFKVEVGIKDFDKNKYKMVSRIAARAVIFKEGKLLMVHTNRGDYKFAGGGVKTGEDIEAGLIREVEEELGYKVTSVNKRIGVIIGRNIDKYEENAIFEMTSHYYLCQVSDIQVEQNLDDYEKEEEYCPVWVTIEEAISNNQLLIKEGKDNMNEWVDREILALKEIEKAIVSNI